MENENLEYVGFWARVVATIVDSLYVSFSTYFLWVRLSG